MLAFRQRLLSRRRHTKHERSRQKTTDPFDVEATPRIQDSSIVYLESNPEEWTIVQEDTEEKTLVKGQNKSGDIYEATITTSFNDQFVKVFIHIWDNTYGTNSYWDTTYKFENATDIMEAEFYNSKSSLIAWWSIEKKLPKEFCRCAFRRSRNIFWLTQSRASLFALQVRAEREQRAEDGKRDLFSS